MKVVSFMLSLVVDAARIRRAVLKEKGEFLLNVTAAKEEFLAEVNKYRCMHGVEPYVWNDKMAQNAAVQAGEPHNNADWDPKAVANQASGYATIADAVYMWYKEVDDCPSMPGCGGKPTHFTCLVWKVQYQMGCAVNPTGSGGKDPYYVCHMGGGEDPTGGDFCNIDGAYEENVLAKVKSESECSSPSPSPSPSPNCDPSADEATDCGWTGITRDECESKGCCYAEGGAGGFWCWHPAEEQGEFLLDATAGAIGIGAETAKLTTTSRDDYDPCTCSEPEATGMAAASYGCFLTCPDQGCCSNDGDTVTADVPKSASAEGSRS